jgi:hypothetical protein
MEPIRQRSRDRWSALALFIAGVGFVVYPALRPFSDEVSLQGAAAFASGNWIAAHMIAMLAFTMLLPGLFGLYSLLGETRVERLAYAAIAVSMIGVGFTLPFYGGEAYGLHAIGLEAMRQGDAALLNLASTIRSGPGLIMFLVGLIILAVGVIMLAASIWRSGRYSKWSGIPLALGMALYIPQFFGTQPLRVAHGVLMAVGCLWIGVVLWPSRKHAFRAQAESSA